MIRTRYRAYSTRAIGEQVQLRTLNYDVEQHGLPRCAWCQTCKLHPLADVLFEGPHLNIVAAICYCVHCQKVTVVEYEQRRKAD
jgi:hypothetical protein